MRSSIYCRLIFWYFCTPFVSGMASVVLSQCAPWWWGRGAAGEQGPLHGNSAAGQVRGELLDGTDAQQGERRTVRRQDCDTHKTVDLSSLGCWFDFFVGQIMIYFEVQSLCVSVSHIPNYCEGKRFCLWKWENLMKAAVSCDTPLELWILLHKDHCHHTAGKQVRINKSLWAQQYWTD